jgi:LysR family transcriptional regulator, regulator for metE and metH
LSLLKRIVLVVLMKIINMEFRHLKMIQEVAKQGNLSKAAEHLYLSQSALSHQLKEIESFFDTQIFIRQKKQMLLTTTGKVLLETSDRILEEVEIAKKRIRTLTDTDSGEICLSTECYTSYHWLSGFLSDFKNIYPKVEVNIVPDATYDSINYLLENKIDIAIVEDNLNPKLNYTSLFRDEFLAVVPPAHKWAQLKHVAFEDFFDENYIMYNIPSEISTIFRMIFSQRHPKKVYKISLTEAILQMVKAGLGVTVLPHWVVKPYIEGGELIVRPITRKGIKRTWYAATLKNKVIPPYMTAFIKNLSKHLKQSEELTMIEYN